jgi:hypothetical protein
MSGTSGAPAANASSGSSNNNNNNQGGVSAVSTTPVKARTKTASGVGGIGGVSSLSPSSLASTTGGTTTTTTVPPTVPLQSDADPGANLDLADLPLEPPSTKPLVKPTGVMWGVVWDGTSVHGEPCRLGLALAAMQFWRKLSNAVRNAKWSEDFAWIYVTSYGTTGTLGRDAMSCTNLGEFKLYLERRYFRDVTVAELVAPVYQVAQTGSPIADYAREGARVWALVRDLIPSQEKIAVQFWSSQLDTRWAQHNQAIFSVLRSCATWDQVEDSIAAYRNAIWDEQPPRQGNNGTHPGTKGRGGPSRGGPSPPSTPPAVSGTVPAGAGGGKASNRANKNGPGCWTCGSLDHRRRDCLQTDKADGEQGKGLGKSE